MNNTLLRILITTTALLLTQHTVLANSTDSFFRTTKVVPAIADQVIDEKTQITSVGTSVAPTESVRIPSSSLPSDQQNDEEIEIPSMTDQPIEQQIQITGVSPREVTNQSFSIKDAIKENNKELILEESTKIKQELTTKEMIIQNIQNQEILDLDKSSSVVTEALPSDYKITPGTDTSLIKKYGGFKGYQQALLIDVLSDEQSVSTLEDTLGELKIQELTQQFSEINKQYKDIILQKDTTDGKHRQLLLSMNLTNKGIQETIASINKRLVKIKLVQGKVDNNFIELEKSLPALEQAEKDLIRYTQTYYKLHNDIFETQSQEKVNELKLFAKSDNIAETLASDLLVKDLTLTLEELVETIATQRVVVNLTQKRQIKEKESLENELDGYENEKDILEQQITNYKEFFLYVKSNKAYIDNKRSELEQEKLNLGNNGGLLDQLNEANSPEELAKIKELLQKETGDESTFFDFPITEIKKITSFFEDEDYNALFGVNHHFALDFRLAQGSSVFAPADGYVYKVINQNSSMLNRFIVLHQNNLATVYLHMQDTFVQEGEYIKKGDILGLSGGTPGTRGAGYMTTGPHLHREVWKNAKVVDPLLYTDLTIIADESMLQERHKLKWEKDTSK